MVVIGATGPSGVAAVLGVAAVVCVSSAVAGEMLQDLKVGHLLGGTPWKMQVGNIFGILIASMVLYFPLMLLIGAFKLGSKDLPAPQAGLMAALAKGIVGGEMAWPLVIVGMVMGFALILVKVSSPMLVAVGMYLPLETTFAIFCGGMIKGIVDTVQRTAQAQRRPEGADGERRHPARGRSDRRRGPDRASAGPLEVPLLPEGHRLRYSDDLRQPELSPRDRGPRPDRVLPHRRPAEERRRARRAAAAVGRHLTSMFPGSEVIGPPAPFLPIRARLKCPPSFV